MLFYLALYLLLGVILTMIAIELSEHKLTTSLLIWGALIVTPYFIYHVGKLIFKGVVK